MTLQTGSATQELWPLDTTQATTSSLGQPQPPTLLQAEVRLQVAEVGSEPR